MREGTLSFMQDLEKTPDVEQTIFEYIRGGAPDDPESVFHKHFVS
jgi:hypothetical protein